MRIIHLLTTIMLCEFSFGQCDCPDELVEKIEFQNLRVCSNSIYQAPQKDKLGRTIYFIDQFKIYNALTCNLIIDMDKEIQTSFNFYIGDTIVEIQENILLPCLNISDENLHWSDQTGRCAFNIVSYSVNQIFPSKVHISIPKHSFFVDKDSLDVIKTRIFQELTKFDLEKRGLIDSLLTLDKTGTLNPDLVYYGILIGLMNNDQDLIELFESFEFKIPEVKISSHEMIMKNMKYVKENFKNGG